MTLFSSDQTHSFVCQLLVFCFVLLTYVGCGTDIGTPTRTRVFDETGSTIRAQTIDDTTDKKTSLDEEPSNNTNQNNNNNANQSSVSLDANDTARGGANNNANATPLSPYSPEWFGAVADGVADDTNSLQQAIDANDHVLLSTGKTYKISRALQLQESSHIDGNATLLMGESFDNVDASKVRSGESMAFIALDKNNITLQGFKIVKPLVAGHFVSAILIQRGRQISIMGLDISGFSNSTGIISLDSITGANVSDNYIHDCKTTGDVQLTGILVDDNRLSDANGSTLNSSAIVITRNRIARLEVDAMMAANGRFESDAIHIAGTGSHDIEIFSNDISHVGEGIDCFGQSVDVHDNVIYEPYGVGVKFVHGASEGRIVNNKITRSGLWGIVLAGSPHITQNTENNIVSNNEIIEPGQNPLAKWPNNTRSGIALVLNGETGFPVNNTVSENTIIDVSGVHFGLLCEKSPNLVQNNEVSGQPLTEGNRDCP